MLLGNGCQAGYLLEFERFNPHPENAQLLPQLDRLPTYNTAVDAALGPLGFKATIIWMYHPADRIQAARAFYTDQGLGLTKVCDQPAVAVIWQVRLPPSSSSSILPPLSSLLPPPTFVSSSLPAPPPPAVQACVAPQEDHG